MVLRGKGNQEDTYETMQKPKNFDDRGSSGAKYEDVEIPATCDVKETLIDKLEELDNKIYHLLESNKYLQEEIKDTETKQEVEEYKVFIAENQDVILNLKNQMLRILNAFMKAGTNLEKEIYPKLKYKGLYMPEFANDHICDHQIK